MKLNIWKRLLGLLLSAAILTGAVPAALAAESESGDFTWRQVDNSAVTASLERRSVPEREEAEPLYAEDEIVRVSIELNDVPTLEKFDLKKNEEYAVNSAARAYRSRLEARQQAVAGAISKQALKGKKLDVVWNLTLAANIISAKVEYDKLDDIKKVAGVKSVFVERQYSPDVVSIGGNSPKMQVSTDMTGTQSGAWESGYKGQGMRVAIIDTGLDADHQSFNEEAFAHALEEDAAADSKTVDDYDLLDAAEIQDVLPKLNAGANRGISAEDLYVTAKIPYGYCYKDKDLDITHDHDTQGEHGSHVAGIATANRYLQSSSSFVSAMETVHMTGQAPDAQVLVMKVFGNSGGAFDSDYMAAIEDAILLGCDTINLSLGSANPGFAEEPGYAYQTILNSLVDKNSVVTVSAGNSGAWSDYAATGGELYSDDVNFSTVSPPGSYTNSFCVASVDNDGAIVGGNVIGGGGPYTMSYFSSWGVPGDLSLKPEVTAPGGEIWSVNGGHMTKDDGIVGGSDQYEQMSGTSMAAPQAAGIGALVKQFIETKGYSQKDTIGERALTQSLMMSTATPLKDENGQYYSVFQQGAGLVNAAAATSADSYLTVDGQNDGKVKFELGDDPEKKGKYQVRFDIHNLDGEAREYELSGELFTQAVRKDEESGFTLLTQGTEALAAAIDWTVEGAVPTPDKSVRGCDFNGDGAVDVKDAQLLLDHVVKGETLLENADKDDIDGDGNTDTHDVHEFLKKLDVISTTVPAKGSITVTADITLDADAAAARMADCPNGFYVEGYLRAAGKDVKDGQAGTAHSIPLLGFYGSWSDPSMFEKGSLIEYVYSGADSLPAPYMDDVLVNYIVASHADGTDTLFGGNPYGFEDSYLPERAAMNSENGDSISAWVVSPIRNAAASRFTVRDVENSALYEDSGNMGPVTGAYYYTDGYQMGWMDKTVPANVNWAGTDQNGAPLSEGTTAQLTLTLAPEYYVEKENVAWEELGEGASLTQQVTIDNTPPELLDVENKDQTIGADRTVTLEVQDNQYVAAVALLDATGARFLSAQSPNQMEEGAKSAVTLDLSQVVGREFKVQVMDYACNTVTYEVEYSGLDSEITDPDYVFFDRNHANWYGLQNGTPQKFGLLHNSTYPVYAAEMVNGWLFALDGPEEDDDTYHFSSALYAMPAGDINNVQKVCDVPYTDLEGREYSGYPLDMAYSKLDHKLYILIRAEETSAMPSYLYSVDPMTGAVALEGRPLDAGNPGSLITLAVDDQGAENIFYGLSGRNLYQFSLSDLSTAEEKKSISPIARLDESLEYYRGYASTDWNSEKGKLVYAVTHRSTKPKPKTEPTKIYELDPASLTPVPAPVYTCAENETFSVAGLAIKDTDAGLDCSPASQASNVILSRTNAKVIMGGFLQLEATVAPWTLADRSVIWSSDNPGVATVTDTGEVRAVSVGTATITAASRATPSVKAECQVKVATVEAGLKALVWDEEGSVWWSEFNTGSLPAYDKKQMAEFPYASAVEGTSGTLYAATLEDQVSVLYAVDPATLQGTEIGPLTWNGTPVYVTDLAPIASLSQSGTDYLLGICSGSDGLVINAATGVVEKVIALNDGTGALAVGIAHLGMYPGLYADLYEYVDTEGGVHSGLICPPFDIISFNSDADFYTGVSTNDCAVYNSLTFANADDGDSYLFWSVYDGDESSEAAAKIYAIDLMTGQTYPMGSFPAGVWPVSGLIAKNVPAVEEVSGFSEEMQKKIKSAQENAGGTGIPGSLHSIEVKDDEGHSSVQVTVDTTAKTVTVPIAAAQSANGRFTLEYDPEVLTFQSISCGGSALHSENTELPKEIDFGYADSSEINGILAKAVFTYEPAEEERTTAISLRIMEDGETCNATPADGGSAEITLPAKPAEPVPPPVTPGPSGTEPEPEPEPEPGPDATKFLDVPEGAWYHDDVSRIAEMGLMVGTSADLFSPGVPLTRGMLAVILYRLEGEPETAAGDHFTDVPSGTWFSEGVNWAAAEGIVAGYENGGYGPDDPITREQLAAIMARYARFKSYDTAVGTGVLDSFQDESRISGWAREGMAWACAMEIICGKGGSVLDPQGKAVRAEAAAILIRFIDLPGHKTNP